MKGKRFVSISLHFSAYITKGCLITCYKSTKISLEFLPFETEMATKLQAKIIVNGCICKWEAKSYVSIWLSFQHMSPKAYLITQ